MLALGWTVDPTRTPMGLPTTILSLLFLAVLRSPVQQPAPTPEQIASFKPKLAAALEPGADPKVRRQMILKSRDHEDASIVAVLDAKALRHDDRDVRDQAVNCLGFMVHPDAWKVLQQMFKRDQKELESAPTRFAVMVRALARNGNPDSIPLLVEVMVRSTDSQVVRSCILGLANIRTKESVDPLMQMMRSAERPRVADVMLEMRTALHRLTGVDKGTDQDPWIDWYDEVKDTLVIPPAPPEERPFEIRRCWSLFWGEDAGKHKLDPSEKDSEKGKKKVKEQEKRLKDE